jgi:hypothetical protein
MATSFMICWHKPSASSSASGSCRVYRHKRREAWILVAATTSCGRSSAAVSPRTRSGLQPLRRERKCRRRPQLGPFLQAQSDTPAKLAAFVYAVLDLEIGAHELLKRTAHRCGDGETKLLCERILADKRAMAYRIVDAFDSAVEATLVALS